jgi:urease accessory protein
MIISAASMADERESKSKSRSLIRSSPRKRGPRLFRPTDQASRKELDSRFRGNDRKESALSNDRRESARENDGRVGPLDLAALYRLMAWLSPSYPIGAFSYSGGIEWAVETGDIRDAATLQDWIAAMLTQGSGFCDAVLFAETHRLAAADGRAALAAVAELASALASSKERHLETTAQGRAFLDTTRAAWPCAALDALTSLPEVALPVAAGTACAGHAIPLVPALAAYLHAQAATLISAGVRLVPLGQTDGQRILAALEPVVAAVAARAIATPLAELGGAAFRADLASMRHETQYTRLFRS